VSELWLPGVSAPLDELISRIHLRIEAFAAKEGKQARVEVDLRDGGNVTVRSLSAEPGFGFVTLCPHADDGADEEWIVPVGAVARITLRVAEKDEPFGFSLPSRD
jgi:hypothetical protein